MASRSIVLASRRCAGLHVVAALRRFRRHGGAVVASQQRQYSASGVRSSQQQQQKQQQQRGEAWNSEPAVGGEHRRTADAAAAFAKHQAAAAVPRAVFPWRHSPLPIHRDPRFPLGPGMPPFPWIPTLFMHVSAYNLIDVPIHHALSYWTWLDDEELAHNFAWAFARGVSGMIGNTYSFGEDDGVSSEDLDHVEEDGSIHIKFDRTLSLNDDNDSSSDHDDDDSMLESGLRNLYRSALQHHSSSSTRLRIKLHTRPTSAHIQSLYFIPVLTRSHVKHNPSLRYRFNGILKDIVDDRMSDPDLGTMATGRLFVDKLVELEDRVGESPDHYDNTIVAQVSVVCRESFEVRRFAADDDEGVLLQGTDGLERDVVHLVRFEKVAHLCKESGHKVGEGPWQIADWDDLLDGNIWF